MIIEGTEAIVLENIMHVMDGHRFGKRESEYIVGGKKRLRDLITAGKIRVEKNMGYKHSKWYCNAADVLKFTKNRRYGNKNIDSEGS